MPTIIRASSLNRIVPGPEHRPVAPVLWPRWVQTGPRTGRMVMSQIPAEAIPAGWQSVRVRVPMKIATCEEAECDFFTAGWSEVMTGETSHPMAGRIDPEQAGQLFGFGGQGAIRIPPTVIHHNPGTPCPRIHKVPAGLPPLYLVNGRTVLWNEFEDSLLGGWQAASRMG